MLKYVQEGGGRKKTGQYCFFLLHISQGPAHAELVSLYEKLSLDGIPLSVREDQTWVSIDKECPALMRR